MDKIGDELCKRCKIDIQDPTTTTGKWNNLRKEALKVSTKDDSQMSRLLNVKQIDNSGSHPVNWKDLLSVQQQLEPQIALKESNEGMLNWLLSL